MSSEQEAASVQGQDERLPLPQSVDGGGTERQSPKIEDMETLPSDETPMKDKESSPALTSSSSLPSPLLPLPDFMTALNMQPSKTKVLEGEGVANDSTATEEEVKMSLGPGPKEVLIQKFKQGAHIVLCEKKTNA